jgi:hypothetical protein
MRRALRENALCVLCAGVGSAAIAWLGLYGPGWNDYETEVQPSVQALVHGHIGEFLRLAPVYGGSLIERAPFALLPGLWGGGSLAVYRLLAVPCLLAGAFVGVWLLARMRRAERPRLARAIVIGVCVANPVTLRALELGHPEELLGGALCVAAVLIAAAPSPSRGRALAAGALLGLAIANKQWAILATAPVLLALPPGRRLPALLSAVGVAAVVMAPLLLGSSGAYATGAKAAAASGTAIFQPWQLWWFLGSHGAVVHGLFGSAKPGYRTGPAWTGTVSHPLILAVGLLIGGALWLRRRGARISSEDAFLALAVTLLMRCLLDTWDTVYYLLPAILALLAHEAEGRSHRPPLQAMTVSLLAWAQFQWLPDHLSPDLQSAVFDLWMLSLTGWLGLRLFSLPSTSVSTRRRPVAGFEATTVDQAMTVRSLESPVSTSQPPSRTTVRSSIRTPSLPGR